MDTLAALDVAKSALVPAIRCERVGSFHLLLERLRRSFEATSTALDVDVALVAEDSLRRKRIATVLDSIFDERRDRRSLLHFSALCSDVIFAATLLDLGVAVDPVDTFGQTPLLLACEVGNFEIATLLSSHGANVNRSDEEGTTPLMAAAGERHYGVGSLLGRTRRGHPSH